MGFVHIAAMLESQAAARASSAFSLLAALTVLFGLFILGLVMIMLLRRTRLRRLQESKSKSDPIVDPWAESAKRLQPYAPPQDRPEE